MKSTVLTWVHSHPVLTGALACALVGTANAEYTLATGTHVNEYVALAVPGALDLYVIQALRVHRDVAAAVLVMVAANVASHLLTAGLYPAGYWWDFGITAGVGALAPGIVWRVHSLERTRNRAVGLGLDAGAVSAPEEYTHPEPAPVIAPAMDYGPSAPAPAWSPGFHLDGCDGVHALEGPLNCTWRAEELTGAPAPAPDWTALAKDRMAEYTSAPVPDSVPDEWTEEEFPSAGPVPYLVAVPDPECAEADVSENASAVHLNLGDDEYVPIAREYVAGADAPTVRGLKAYAKVGQARAERLLEFLGVRP